MLNKYDTGLFPRFIVYRPISISPDNFGAGILEVLLKDAIQPKGRYFC